MRAKLDMKQLGDIIFLFSRNIHDPSLPLTIQTTSVRLLLNLVDNIFHNKDPEKDKGRDLLVRILVTLVNKFKTLKTYVNVYYFFLRSTFLNTHTHTHTDTSTT